jgi:predicted oxidoreductase
VQPLAGGSRLLQARRHAAARRAGPFYAARIRPGIICWTRTGIRIDTEARVLDGADRPVPGLFAAGETTGGMFGQCYAAGGASIGNAIIFGRIAGRNAALLGSAPAATGIERISAV